jgi:putative transposase
MFFVHKRGNLKLIRLSHIGPEEPRNASRIKQGEAAVWQRRFWEHMIREQDDLHRHTDYIHFNPVKHGLASRAADWPWSSFHRYVKDGYYPMDWGQAVGKDVMELDCGE